MSGSKQFVRLPISAFLLASAVYLAPLSGWSQEVEETLSEELEEIGPRDLRDGDEIEPRDLEEIVVTTRRREELLQDVPIAITAIDSQVIAREGIRSLGDVARLDPSVNFDSGYAPGDTKVTIRGLANTRGRSNVAFLVDGVDVTTQNVIASGSGLLANQRLLRDVERIEIVKGPQSALFGRSAFAGAISYVTKNPSDEFEATLSADAAEYDQKEIGGSVSGPLTDSIGGRLDGVAWTSDGFYNNDPYLGGADLGGGDGYGASGTLTFEPSESLFIKTRMMYSEDNYDPRPIVRITGDLFTPYPTGMIQASDGGIGVGRRFGGAPRYGSLGIANMGSVCQGWDGVPGQGGTPNALTGVGDPLGQPGQCQVGNVGSAEGLSATQSRNMWDEDHKGVEVNLFRWSLNADYDTDYGNFSYTGGYTSGNQFDSHDQDAEDVLALQPGDAGYYIAQQTFEVETDTKQVSNEFRFSTSFDGPVNATVGYLFWNERIDTYDSNIIVACAPVGATQTPLNTSVTNINNPNGLNTTTFVPGVCDGQQGFSIAGSALTATDWRTVARQLASVENGGQGHNITPEQWDSDIDHRSLYAQLEILMTEKLRFTLENRYVNESSFVQRPDQTSCSKIGFGIGATPQEGPFGAISEGDAPGQNPDSGVFPFNPLFDDSTTIFGDVSNRCESASGGAGGYEVIANRVNSYYNTPKVTLDYDFNNDVNAYMSWGRGLKPGGTSVGGGGGPPGANDPANGVFFRDSEEFEPERLDAYEFGIKTAWVAAGALAVNAAVFYNDYSDKQVRTQVLRNDQLNPIVTNASSAEVTGAEVDINWIPAFLEGLSLRAAYTWQDPEYSDFVEPTTAPQRIAAAYYVNPANDCTNVVESTTGTSVACEIDLSGNQLERAARNAFFFSADLFRPINSDLEWFVHGDASYTDKRYYEADNVEYWDEVWIFNANAGLASERWEVQLFVDNILDDDTFQTGFRGPDFGKQVTLLGFTGGLGTNSVYGLLPDPRVVGVRASYRFGSAL